MLWYLWDLQRFICIPHPSPGDVKFLLISVSRQICFWANRNERTSATEIQRGSLGSCGVIAALLGLRARLGTGPFWC